MNIHEIALASVRRGSRLFRPADWSTSACVTFPRLRQVGAKGRWPDAPGGLRPARWSPILGFPLQLVESEDLPAAAAPALFLNVILTDAKIGETRPPLWSLLAPRPTPGFRSARSRSAITRRFRCLTGRLAKAIDRAIAGPSSRLNPLTERSAARR